jgi:cyclohexanone monooxygenase
VALIQDLLGDCAGIIEVGVMTTNNGTAAASNAIASTDTFEEHHWDVVVVGAGFAGLYATYRFREMGYRVRTVERAGNVGGTWFWNSYPGLRCDTESFDYSYSFSAELQQEWTWTERFATQSEILRYLEHVADRFDLRRHISFETAVVGATYLDERGAWRIDLRGPAETQMTCTYLVMATGPLSEPNDPPFEGIDSFAGKWYQTSRWPETGVDLTGKRVAIIGTGSTGIQVTTAIAPEVAHLSVFQRTANFSVPAQNRAIHPTLASHHKGRYDKYRAAARYAATGSTPRRDFDEPGYGPMPTPLDVAAVEIPAEDRQAELERRWSYGGAAHIVGAFADTMSSEQTNDVVASFVRDKIRSIVKDPETAAVLTPQSYPIGAKRVCLDTGYYETFNRNNVELVDISSNPIARITTDGIQLQDGVEHSVDVIIFALGFDALTGALTQIDVRGRNGLSLRQVWSAGPRTFLGLTVAGFPNMFTIAGPNSPSVLSNVVMSIEQHVDLVADLLREAAARERPCIEATSDAQDKWVDHCSELASTTLYPKAASWYMGANIPGKPRAFLAYVGGVGRYREHCEQLAEDGYPGFDFQGAAGTTRMSASEGVANSNDSSS